MPNGTVPDIFGALARGQQFALQEQAIRAQQAEAQRRSQIQQLLGQVGQPVPVAPAPVAPAAALADMPEAVPEAMPAPVEQPLSQQELIQQARRIDPALAEQQLKLMGLDEPSRRAEASRFAAEVQSLPFDFQTRRIQERAERLRAEGRDPSDTLELLQMDPAQRMQALQGVQMLDLSTKERLAAQERRTRQAEIPAGQREFENLIKDMTPEEKAAARRIKVGLDPRATGSADLTIAQQNLADLVAGSKAKIAEKVKFAEATGSKRAGMIDKAFTRVAEIEQGIGNIDKAIQAIDEGAQSGPLINRFTPTIRAQTKRLEQVRNLMALDVLNSATFGALSEKELEVVQQTAMPDLPPKELREWLQLRREGMRKLQTSIREQAIFLDEGGTQAGFLRKMAKEAAAQEQPAQTVAPTAAPTEPVTQVIRFDAQGNIIQ